MNAQLLQLLPGLLPLAEQWANEQEAVILATGVPLSEQGSRDAAAVGVREAQRIRLLAVSAVPMPAHPALRQAAIATSLISPNTIGLTLRYGIFIRKDYWGDRELVAHECVHTAQYERLGGFALFLTQYLRECIEIGYPEAPMEQEAIHGVKRIYGGDAP